MYRSSDEAMKKNDFLSIVMRAIVVYPLNLSTQKAGAGESL